MAWFSLSAVQFGACAALSGWAHGYTEWRNVGAGIPVRVSKMVPVGSGGPRGGVGIGADSSASSASSCRRGIQQGVLFGCRAVESSRAQPVGVYAVRSPTCSPCILPLPQALRWLFCSESPTGPNALGPSGRGGRPSFMSTPAWARDIVVPSYPPPPCNPPPKVRRSPPLPRTVM